MNKMTTSMMLCLAMGLLVQGACGGGEPVEIVFELEIQDRALAGAEIVRVGQNDDVILQWTTNEAVTIHIHGYDIEKQVIVGELTVVQFTAKATGRFLIEGYTAEADPEEGHTDGGHADDGHNDEAHEKHGFPLVYLEVMPR